MGKSDAAVKALDNVRKASKATRKDLFEAWGPTLTDKAVAQHMVLTNLLTDIDHILREYDMETSK